MTKLGFTAAGLLAGLAGSAVAQPVVDGVRDGSGYSQLWVQNVPTHFGDNAGGGNCNENDVGTPAAVTTGHELKIPLAAIGNPAGSVKLFVALGNGGHNAVSNQTLPGLATGTANLGNARAVNYAAIAGTQSVTVAVNNAFTPTIDGTNGVGEYPAALAVQTNRTGYDDSTGSVNGDTANGSELDNLSAVISNGFLYIFIGGNLKSDFGAKLELFIDNNSGGGYNQLTQGLTLPDVDFGALQNMLGTATDPGLTFETGFNCTHYMTYGAGGGPVTYYPNLADLTTLLGSYLGCNQAGNGEGTLDNCGGNNPNGIEVALNNANAAGVPARCPPAQGNRDIATGSELDNLSATISGGRLYLFLGGNLQNNFNKIELFFDVAPGGQNTLRGDNVDIDFNGLNKMGFHGDGSSDPGLTFDAGFDADYWIGFTNGGDPLEVYTNAAPLRTDGPRKDFSNNNLDYGSYEGGVRSRVVDTVSVNDPINWDGKFGDPYNQRLDIQDGFTAQLFTNFPPRTAGDSLLIDPFNPVGVPGLINQSINNSNILGVTDTAADAGAAALVSTGYEVSVALSELGWDGVSQIKVVAFVNNSGHDYLSNQVVGGLPEGTDNLGNARLVNFAGIPGSQFVIIPNGCPADFNDDGFLDFFDIDAYIACFEGTECPPGKDADFNGDDFVDFFDIDAYVAAFEVGC